MTWANQAIVISGSLTPDHLPSFLAQPYGSCTKVAGHAVGISERRGLARPG